MTSGRCELKSLQTKDKSHYKREREEGEERKFYGINKNMNATSNGCLYVVFIQYTERKTNYRCRFCKKTRVL